MIQFQAELGHEYHVVELNNVRPPDAMWDWLKFHCGDPGTTRWMYKHPNIYFADKQDHFMFLLRFSGE